MARSWLQTAILFLFPSCPFFEFMNSMKFDQLNLSYDIFTPVSIICIGHQHAHDTEHNYTLSGAARFTPAHAVAGCKGRQLLCGWMWRWLIALSCQWCAQNSGILCICKYKQSQHSVREQDYPLLSIRPVGQHFVLFLTVSLSWSRPHIASLSIVRKVCKNVHGLSYLVMYNMHL